MRTILIRCYPARWRARYGDEFLALLEDRPLGPYDVADILLGALDAQLRLRGRDAPGPDRRGISMSLRLGGLAAIIGAVLWAVAGLASLGVVGAVEDGVPVALLLIGMLALLVAVAGLSAFQARIHPEATWAAFIVTAVGTLIFFAGYVGMAVTAQDGFWGLWFVGFLTVVLGSGLFAAVTYRTRVLSRLGAALIGIAIATMLSQIVLPIPELLPVAMACFALGWFTLGVQAIRLDRPAAAASSPA